MRFIRGFLLTALVLALFPLEAYAERSNIKVLMLPFVMNSKENISALRRSAMDSLASSLNSAGADIAGIDILKELVLEKGVASFTDESALDLGRKVPADFALLGSITRLGGSIGVDLRVLDVKDGKTVAFFHRSSNSDIGIARLMNEAGPELYGRMFSAMNVKPVARTGNVDRIVISGNKRVDAEAVLKKLLSRPGAPYSPDDVRDDIRAIYATGFFDDVKADLSDTASGKTLTFIVKEMPFIKKIEVKGNKEVKEDKIREGLTLKENTVLDRVLLGENAEKIKAVYADEGYYLAAVKPVVESDGVEAKVVFEINEGPEVKVKRITPIGNRFFTSGKIRGFMSTEEVGFFSILTKSGKFDEFIFQNDLNIIIGKYYDNGYINAEIADYRVLLSDDKQWLYATIAINEGEQFRIGKIDVRGDLLEPKETLLGKLKLKSGEVFSRTKLSNGLDAITDVYGDKGYAYADIKPLTEVDKGKKTIDLVVDIKKNDLVYIERIDILNNVRTRDKVIRREVELGEGDLYNSSALKRSKSNLKRLGYFDDVRISQSQGAAPDKIKLNVDVKERATGSISVGFGYSSVDRLIGTASISQSNFMGTGLKLEVSGTISASSSKYVLSFTEPWLFDKPLSAGFDLYNSDKQYSDFDLNKKGFDVRFGFPVADRYTRGYLTYKYEIVNITNVSDSASSYIKEQAGLNTESSVTAMIRRDTRDDAFFPTEGSVLSASSEFAGGPLGGTSYFIKNEADAVKFFPLPLNTTFSLHGAIGFVQGYAGHDAPIYEKYFLGGINSIRGFETRSISPKDPATGDLIGGDKMIAVNTEFLFPLFPEQKIKGVVFFDIGNAYLGSIDLTDLRKGAGFGVRWFSPIGPLRLELGFNLDRRPGEKAQQWDFTIGAAF